MTDEEIGALSVMLDNGAVWWRRPNGGREQVARIGPAVDPADAPDPVAYLVDPPNHYIALYTCPLDEFDFSSVPVPIRRRT